MLVDAIRAEGFRLSKNRTALFWSVVFVPVLSIALGTLTSFVLKGGQTKLLEGANSPELAEMMSRATLDLSAAMISAAGSLANPLVLLFVLIPWVPESVVRPLCRRLSLGDLATDQRPQQPAKPDPGQAGCRGRPRAGGHAVHAGRQSG